MSLLAGYHTEAALLAVLDKSGMKLTQRALQLWRQQRRGPPWTKLGKKVLYPDDGFLAWLKSQEQQPVRSRKPAHK